MKNEQAGLNSYNVPVSASQVDPVAGPAIPFGPSRGYVLTFQPTQLPYFAGTGLNSPMFAQITYWQGAASYTLTLTLSTLARRYMALTANRVEVHFYQVGGNTSYGIIRASVTEGYVESNDFYAWSASPIGPVYGDTTTDPTGTTVGQLMTGPGVMGNFHVVLQTAAVPNTPLYVLFFDSNIAPTTAVGHRTPIRLAVSDAVFNAGDSRSADFVQSGAGAISWTYGLWCALSTDPHQLVEPAAGNVVYVDVMVGL
jgi:hypothetical protein